MTLKLNSFSANEIYISSIQGGLVNSLYFMHCRTDTCYDCTLLCYWIVWVESISKYFISIIVHIIVIGICIAGNGNETAIDDRMVMLVSLNKRFQG